MDDEVEAEGLGAMAGRVVALDGDVFEADLLDAEGVVEILGYRVAMDKVAREDRDRVKVGATFSIVEDDGNLSLDFD